MPFSADILTNSLSQRGISAEVFCYSSTGSTNNDARALCSSVQGDFLVAADSQSAGKGSHERSFFSPKGGFYLTCALRGLDMSLPVTMAAAVAARQSILEVCKKQVGIKWVNDLIYCGKKVCGILCERLSDGSVLVGIGINLTSPEGGFPEEIMDVAAALEVDESCKNALAAEVYQNLTSLLRNAPQKIMPSYREGCETIGQRVRFILKGEQHIANVLAVEDGGALLVQQDDGEQLLLQSGDVSIRPV